MTDIDYSQIVKWVLIVLAAGFIGQFGKTLATYLINRTRGAKNPGRSGEATGSVEEPKEVAAPPLSKGKDSRIKMEKKASKALIKLEKKRANNSKP